MFDLKTLLLNLALPLLKAKSPEAAQLIEDAKAAYEDKRITWIEAKIVIIDALNTIKSFWKEGSQVCEDLVIIIEISVPPVEKFILDIEALSK